MELSTGTYTTRQGELNAAKEVRGLLDRFRNGTAIQLDELSEKLTAVARTLAARIGKDDMLLREGLIQMTYLDGSLVNHSDGLDCDFTFKKADPHVQDLLDGEWGRQEDNPGAMERNPGVAVDETLKLPSLTEVTEAVNCVIGVFDLNTPDVSEQKYLETILVFSHLFNGFRGSDLDPLREQLGGIVDFDQEPSQATDNERGVRALGKVLAQTVETRIQRALIASAGASISALLANNLAELKEAAAHEMLMQMRIRTAWKFSLVLASLTGQQKF